MKLRVKKIFLLFIVLELITNIFLSNIGIKAVEIINDMANTKVNETNNNDDEKIYEGMKYKIIDNEITIVGFVENEIKSNITIPDIIEGYRVKNIGQSAFRGCTVLENVVIQNGIVNIEDAAFERCSYLKSIIIPSSVRKIGSAVFLGCVSLSNIIIANGLISIGYQAFAEMRCT